MLIGMNDICDYCKNKVRGNSLSALLVTLKRSWKTCFSWAEVEVTFGLWCCAAILLLGVAAGGTNTLLSTPNVAPTDALTESQGIISALEQNTQHWGGHSLHNLINEFININSKVHSPQTLFSPDSFIHHMTEALSTMMNEVRFLYTHCRIYWATAVECFYSASV